MGLKPTKMLIDRIVAKMKQEQDRLYKIVSDLESKIKPQNVAIIGITRIAHPTSSYEWGNPSSDNL
jgi:hypothetical protein